MYKESSRACALLAKTTRILEVNPIVYPQGESKRQGNFMGLNMLLLFKANNFVTLLVSRGLKHGYYI